MFNPLAYLIHWLFPPTCAVCGQNNTNWCDDCQYKIKKRPLICPLCDKAQDQQILCTACANQTSLDKILVSATYLDGGLDKVIHAFKYQYHSQLAVPLAQLLIQRYQNIDMPDNCLIIPTPLHRRRYNERGFNQAELLANHFGLALKIPVKTNILHRKKYNDHQANLNRQQRLINVANSFSISKNIDLADQTIILIDDVITTGATLDEQAKLLKQNNARAVWALVLAKN
ncbi:MAG: ComF family protein [Candidatus Komeilibacteria bacterium]